MAVCNEMKAGEVYRCENCGLELKVLQPCESGEEYDGGSGTCSCTQPVTCCGQPLTLQKQVATESRQAVA